MTRLHLVVVMLLAAAVEAAQQPWPPRVADVAFSRVDTSDLPEALRSALRSYDEFSKGRSTLVLVSQSRGGAQRLTRIAQRYDGAGYRVVRIADYEQTDGTERFLKERDPRELGR